MFAGWHIKSTLVYLRKDTGTIYTKVKYLALHLQIQFYLADKNYTLTKLYLYIFCIFVGEAAAKLKET